MRTNKIPIDPYRLLSKDPLLSNSLLAIPVLYLESTSSNLLAQCLSRLSSRLLSATLPDSEALSLLEGRLSWRSLLIWQLWTGGLHKASKASKASTLKPFSQFVSHTFTYFQKQHSRAQPGTARHSQPLALVMSFKTMAARDSS